MSCGNGFECDNGYGVCPDDAEKSTVPARASNSTTITARAVDCVRASVRAVLLPCNRKLSDWHEPENEAYS